MRTKAEWLEYFKCTEAEFDAAIAHIEERFGRKIWHEVLTRGIRKRIKGQIRWMRLQQVKQ